MTDREHEIEVWRREIAIQEGRIGDMRLQDGGCDGPLRVFVRGVIASYQKRQDFARRKLAEAEGKAEV